MIYHSPSILNLISDEIVLDPAQNAFLCPSINVDPLVHCTRQSVMKQSGTLHRCILIKFRFVKFESLNMNIVNKYLEAIRFIPMPHDFLHILHRLPLHLSDLQ